MYMIFQNNNNNGIEEVFIDNISNIKYNLIRWIGLFFHKNYYFIYIQIIK